jgi:PAS domain S-box-containing protein
MNPVPDPALPDPWAALANCRDLPLAVVDPAGSLAWTNHAFDSMRAVVMTLVCAEGVSARPVLAEDLGRLLAERRGSAVETRLETDARGDEKVMRWTAASLAPADTGAMTLIVGLDVSDEHQAAAKSRRMIHFHRALYDIGRAFSRLDGPGSLYRTACEMAVEVGGAAMAWIGLLHAGRWVPVAWGGGARACTRGMELGLHAGSDTPGPSAEAIATGRPSVLNRLQSPGDEPWRWRAIEARARSMGAFPLVRAGDVVGVLHLYFEEDDVFDADFTALGRQLSSLVGYALAQVDREAARAEAERVAREREQQFAGIVESALDAIIAVDRHQRVVLFNDAASRMFGVTAREAVGGRLERFLPMGDRAAHRAHVERYAREGLTSRRMGYAREVRGLRAGGEEFPMEASISRTGDGDRLLMIVTARDVTQLRQAERSQAARAAAEAANQAKTEFLSRISHELRTPLNAVLGFSRLLSLDAANPLNERQRSQVELVLQAAEHLRALIDDMIDVSAIEAGRVAIEVRDFELCELIEGVLRMSEPHAQEAGVILEALRRRHCPILMRSDPGRLRQILLNLVSNAIKYNRPGGHVRIDLERDPYFIHIAVSDEGIGMAAEQLAQLFQPFNRLGREAGSVPGTGIGLTLVRQLAGLLGGEVTVESQPGRGTSVRLTLPAAGARPALGAVADPAARPGVTTPEALDGVVLYVEDNPVNAILVEQLLSRWPGVQLVVARDGASGLERARSLHPDVLLLDMQLPDMSGRDVLQALRADPATRAMRVVALSATALAQDVAAARDLGVADYWTKPIDVASFIAGMRSLLSR